MLEGPVWIALHNDVVVGTASAVLRVDELYIRGMAVLPLARGLHIGERLLAALESFALAHNCRRMVLSTTPFLLRAIRLYERARFTRAYTNADTDSDTNAYAAAHAQCSEQFGRDGRIVDTDQPVVVRQFR